MARKSFGGYMLEERLAVGGMGELYLASTSADRPLSVVKILHREFLENEEYVTMFEDEGRIGSRLAHTNIVGVHDTGRVGEVPYIVFEFIDGENLRTVLKACTDVGMPVPPEIAVRIVIGVLLGLDHAHRAKDERGRPMNLVHRDLSPDNIVVSWDGEPKILDFGIAKADGRAAHTQVGILKGKSQYMAPEQAKLGVVDQRSDLYSAGVVLLELLTGRRRFDHDDPVQQIIAAQEWTAYKPSDYATWLPAEVDAIVLKALARSPENRFQTSEAFAVALTRVLQQGLLPRSEPIASFLRRVFPGRTKRAAVVSNEEQTLSPKPGSSPLPPRMPLPTVRKAPAFAPPPTERPRPSEEPTSTRTATAPGAGDDEPTRAPGALPNDDTDERTRARGPLAPFGGDDTDERTRAGAPLVPFGDDETGEAVAPPPRAAAATPPASVVEERGGAERRAGSPPGGRTADQGRNDRPTRRQTPAMRADDRPTVDASVPPPIVRPPGSTPRTAGSGAIRLDIPVDESIYQYLDAPVPPPGKSDVRRAPAAQLAVKKARPRAGRRLGPKLLLGVGLAAAGAGAVSEYRARLEKIPQVAVGLAWVRERVGAATPPVPPETPPAIRVIGSGGESAPLSD